MESAVIVEIIKAIIVEAPGAIAGIQALLAKPNPTAEDYAAAKAQIQKDTYDSLVPNAAKFPVE